MVAGPKHVTNASDLGSRKTLILIQLQGRAGGTLPLCFSSNCSRPAMPQAGQLQPAVVQITDRGDEEGF